MCKENADNRKKMYSHGKLGEEKNDRNFQFPPTTNPYI